MSFKSNSTLSSLRISTTNIRGLGVGGPNEGKKLNCLLDLKTDLTIITDSHADLTKLNSLKSNNRQLLSQYDLIGHNSLKRGVTVMIKHSSGCTVEKLTELDCTDTLAFNLICPDKTVIYIIACYAPSDKDNPDYWDAVYEYYMNSNEDYKLILGDYNCTLNHRLDSRGYDTDPHKKCRQRINQWLENGTCCDTYRDLHPNKVGYTFRTKNLKKQARLDYILTSPQLISKVKEIKNVPQTCTDHSSIIMSVDFNCAERGPGVYK